MTPFALDCPGDVLILREIDKADMEMNSLRGRWYPWMRFKHRKVLYLRLLRRAEYWSSSPIRLIGPVLGLFYRIRTLRLGETLGFDLPRNSIGAGFSIAHCGLLVVNGASKIGVRCRMHQGVTLAGTAEGAPVVGDDVFIGPNAVLVGNIRVGNGAYVYAGAVVTRDVPDGMGAAGVPAEIRAVTLVPWRPKGGLSEPVLALSSRLASGSVRE